MAQMNINLSAKIYAEILIESDTVLSGSALILDPLTNSYTDYPNAKLIYYYLEIIDLRSITNPQILHNGKNSRFTAQGYGECTIRLTVEDSLGNSATDTKTIFIE